MRRFGCALASTRQCAVVDEFHDGLGVALMSSLVGARGGAADCQAAGREAASLREAAAVRRSVALLGEKEAFGVISAYVNMRGDLQNV